LSERAIRGYCEPLLEAGFPPTLFVVPETGQEHGGLLKDLSKRGVEMGMHLHPQCFRDHRYDKFLGQYDREAQKQILAEGAEMLTKAIGVRPRAFRPGNFSASDVTFQVAYELGFRQGSVSDPGRHVPEYHALWKDAVRDAHWASAHNRLAPGDLGFFEAPLTTDPDKRRPNGFPYELRIESGPFDAWHAPIIEQALERMERERTSFRVLSIFTHNYFDYSDPEGRQSKVVRDYIAYLRHLNRRYAVVGATLGRIRQDFVEHTGLHRDR
jgi:peptidoglycan/xylan/chitin deacetylase (PgdA/CDA1 family)